MFRLLLQLGLIGTVFGTASNGYGSDSGFSSAVLSEASSDAEWESDTDALSAATSSDVDISFDDSDDDRQRSRSTALRIQRRSKAGKAAVRESGTNKSALRRSSRNCQPMKTAYQMQQELELRVHQALRFLPPGVDDKFRAKAEKRVRRCLNPQLWREPKAFKDFPEAKFRPDYQVVDAVARPSRGVYVKHWHPDYDDQDDFHPSDRSFYEFLAAPELPPKVGPQFFRALKDRRTRGGLPKP